MNITFQDLRTEIQMDIWDEVRVYLVCAGCIPPRREEESEADYEHRVHQTIDNYINRNSIIQTLILTERVTLARVQILPLGRYHMPRHQTDVHAQAWGQPTRPIDGRTILFPRGLIAPDTGPLVPQQPA